MSNTSIIAIILIIPGAIYLIKQYGLKSGLVFSIALVSMGALLGLVSIYFSDTGKLIFTICIFILIILLNYPPSRKYIIEKSTNILVKILEWKNKN